MYALNLGADGRVLSATYEEYGSQNSVFVDELPDGNIGDYRYSEGTFIYDPLPVPDPEPVPDADLLNRVIYLEDQLASYEEAYMEGVQNA